MKVWVEGVEGAVLAGIRVFRTWENVREYWRDRYGLSDDCIDVLDKDVAKLMNGTGMFAYVGVYVMDDGELRHHCARPVNVDDWFDEKAHKEAEERRKEEELKEREIPNEPLGPCPKCGGEAVVNHPAYDGGAYISCRKCGYSPQRLTWAPTDRRAIYNWNRLTKDSDDS